MTKLFLTSPCPLFHLYVIAHMHDAISAVNTVGSKDRLILSFGIFVELCHDFIRNSGIANSSRRVDIRELSSKVVEKIKGVEV